MNTLARVALTAALVSLLPSLALAHAHLKAAEPADKAVVAAAPQSVKLEFSEGIELKFSGVSVTGPGKSQIKTGDATLAGGKDTALEVPITGSLAPGAYDVEWHVLSKDGHKMKGKTTFTLKP